MFTKSNRNLLKILLLILVPFSMSLCSCAKKDNIKTDNSNLNNHEQINESYNDQDTVNDGTKGIDSFTFAPSDTLLKSTPSDLYLQIADICFSPIESLTVEEYMTKISSSRLFDGITYNICEDDIYDVYSDYSENYLVPAEETVDIYFYYNGQAIFALEALNITKSTQSLKNCYAFRMREAYCDNKLDVSNISWYCAGIPANGNGYDYESIKSYFKSCNMEYEEGDSHGKLRVSALIPESVEIPIDFLNGRVSLQPFYEAYVDKSTGNIVEFGWSMFMYNRSINQ